MTIEVYQKLQSAELAKAKGYEKALAFLEEAHLLAQPKTLPHVYVHWKMLLLAFKFKVWKEFLGQIPRLFLAIPGSLLGKAPKGNIGSTKMGIFEEKIAQDK
jgi:hypothetical protein